MSYYNNGNPSNYGGGYNAGYGQQPQQQSYAQPYAQQQQQQESDFDDYYTHNTPAAQWDSRSAKSSHTMHSNYSTTPMNKPYEQQPPMPAPYQQSPVVDYPPTHRVQFPGNFGGPQRQYTGESAGFSTARDKLLKRRVRRRSSPSFLLRNLLFMNYEVFRDILADFRICISYSSLSAMSPFRMGISFSMFKFLHILSLHPRRVRSLRKCG